MNLIDHITKYVTAHLFVDKRSFSNCVKFLQQIKDTCYEQMLKTYKKEKHKKAKNRKLITFVFDGFSNYENAWSKLFRIVTKGIFGISIKAKKGGLKHNNNHIERHNGKTKDRVKVMRGGFRSFEGAEVFLNLRHIIYNFVHSHQGLNGKTPAEAAEIKLKLGRNRLLGLIRYMAKSKHHSLR